MSTQINRASGLPLRRKDPARAQTSATVSATPLLQQADDRHRGLPRDQARLYLLRERDEFIFSHLLVTSLPACSQSMPT